MKSKGNVGADTTSVMCQEYDPGHCAGLFFAAQVSVFREWREYRGHVMQFPPTGISLRQTCKGIHTYTHERKKKRIQIGQTEEIDDLPALVYTQRRERERKEGGRVIFWHEALDSSC